VLRRILGPKRDEVTGRWRKLYNEEFHNLYSSPEIIRMMIKSRRMRWAGHEVCIGEMRSVYKVLIGKPEERRPLRRPRHRQEDNIKLNLREIGFEDVDLIHMAQDMDWWWAHCEYSHEP
jgi:hypothetical protein